MQFHEKLEYLLQASGLSNSKLSKKMNVDASLISKWRRGIMRPGKRSYLVTLADAVVPYFRSDYLREDLSRIAGIPLESLQVHNEAKRALIDWLSADDREASLSKYPSPGIEIFRSDRLAMRHKGREVALQELAEEIKTAKSTPHLRIYSDESYDWMQIFVEQLQKVFEATPEALSRFGKVSLLYSGSTRSEEEFRCRWEIQDCFSNHCEVTTAFTNERYSGVFSHSLFIVEDVGAISTFGLSGSNSVFCLSHKNYQAVREMCEDYDTLFNQSQIVVRECPNYSAWEEALGFKEMLSKNYSIYYRTYNVPPALAPPPTVQRMVRLTEGSSNFAEYPYEVFECDLEDFLQRNRIHVTLPLLHPKEVQDGLACFPYLDSGEERSNVISLEDYLEILKYALNLYRAHDSLVIKAVGPGEIDHDFLLQEMSRYSISKRHPRRYTHLVTHQAVVANAAKQTRRYFVDAPTTREERMRFAVLVQDTIEEFEEYLKAQSA